MKTSARKRDYLIKVMQSRDRERFEVIYYIHNEFYSIKYNKYINKYAVMVERTPQYKMINFSNYIRR